MYYVTMKDGVAVSATTNHAELNCGEAYEYRADWKTMERAAAVAAQLTTATGAQWIATDAGAGTYPRYDVVPVPVVGAPVSKSFNGDSYPAGTIASVSASLKVVRTTDGTVFHRRRQSGAWVAGGTWSMIGGHRDERNPSF